MKHGVKFATLNYGCPDSIFDPDAPGLIRKIEQPLATYIKEMGHEPPSYPEGTLGAEQFAYRKGAGRSAVELAAPNAKPRRKVKKPRARRKPVYA